MEWPEWRIKAAELCNRTAERLDPTGDEPTIPEMWVCHAFVKPGTPLPAGVRCDFISDHGATMFLLSTDEALDMARGLISSAEDANRYNAQDL